MALKASVFIACSLDGFIARPNGDLDWLDAHHSADDQDNGSADSDEDFGYGEFTKGIDCIVMGRNSFEKVCSFDVDWPYSDFHCCVLSSTLTQVGIPEGLQSMVSVQNLSPVDLVQKLEKQNYRHLYIDGGRTIQGFLQSNLIDKLTITQIPIILGDGISLFGRVGKETNLKLMKSSSFSNGLLQYTYRLIK